VAVKLVTLVVTPRVDVVVTAPVVASIETVSKPFCDLTGPLNVLFAMFNSPCVVAYQSA